MNERDRSASSNEEGQRRIDLAACYRLVAHFQMSDLVFTHISARAVKPEGAILVNPYGHRFDEVRASDLVLLDREGGLLEPADASINPAALTIHTAIHAARPDAACVIHTHSVAGMAIAAQREGLLPVCQHAMKFHGRLGYHDYEGIALAEEERSRLVCDLGSHQAMILRNHGLLAVGRTVAEAFHVIYHLEQACRVQVAAVGGGRALVLPDPAIAERTARQFEAFPQPLGQREWPALLRLLEGLDPSYRE